MPRWAAFLSETYGTADPRSLGLFRILLGLVVFSTLLDRWSDVPAHLSDTGWLPRHLAFEDSTALSVCRWFGSVSAMRAFLLAGSAVALALAAGLRTRAMHWLAFGFVLSVNARNPTIENGGFTALLWLLLISGFLPLGQRFSVDALLAPASPRVHRRVRVTSLAVFALLLQWGAIYAFNYAHKVGPAWEDGSALYYLLHQDNAVTSSGAFLREHAPERVLRLATHAARTAEGAIALLLLLPFTTGGARLLSWGLAVVLHAGIALVIDIGPFSWVMLAGFAVFVRPDSWERWQRWGRTAPFSVALTARLAELEARARGRLSRFADEQQPPSLRWVRRLREAAIGGVLCVQLLELAADNWAQPAWLRLDQRPAWLAALVGRLRLFQHWSLCAPDPPLEVRRLRAVTRTASGAEIDLLDATRGQAWDEVHRRLGERPRLWPGLARYLEGEARRRGAASPPVVRVEWIIKRIPPAPASALAPERRTLFRLPE